MPARPTPPAPHRGGADTSGTQEPGVGADELDALVRLAIETAREAGAGLLAAAQRLAAGDDLDVRAKSSATDPVSEADRASERLIADRLRAARPRDGLVGEEGQAPRPSTSGRTWVVDPLDGTVNFLYGNPGWCVSVACTDAAGALVGVVHDPSRGETFSAARGRGAWLERAGIAGRRRLRCTTQSRIDATLVATGFAYDASVRAEQGSDIADLVSRVRDIRRCGSAALDLCWCAAGRTDAYVEFGLKPWDWAAGALVVAEADGRVTHVERSYATRTLPGLVAGGRAAHDHLLAWLETRR